jgi:hypothetical protein
MTAKTTSKPQANWGNIGSGIWMARTNGVDLYTTRSQGSWAINVAKAGVNATQERYPTNLQAMLAAERLAS